MTPEPVMQHPRDRGSRWLATLAGLGMLASALPHAFGAWPSLQRRLVAQGVEPGLVDTLAAGWFLGTSLMLGSGAVVLLAAMRRARPGPCPLAGLWPLGLAWAAYGIAAFVWRDYATHYLGFIACGAALLLAISLRPRRDQTLVAPGP